MNPAFLLNPKVVIGASSNLDLHTLLIALPPPRARVTNTTTPAKGESDSTGIRTGASKRWIRSMLRSMGKEVGW